jgi:hypothetical protein
MFALGIIHRAVVNNTCPSGFLQNPGIAIQSVSSTICAVTIGRQGVMYARTDLKLFGAPRWACI